MRKFYLLFFLVTSAWPQMTLRQCVQIALAHNPGVQISAVEAQIAQEDWRQAKSSRLPALDFSGSYRRQSTVPELRIDPIELPIGGSFMPFPGGGMELGTYDNFDFRLTLQQPLFTGFRLRGRETAMAALAAGKRADVSRSRGDLIYKVESAYAGVLRAQKFLAIAMSAREQVQMHLRDVGTMVEQGLARNDELGRVRVKLSEAELAIVRAENGVQMAQVFLENLLGERLKPDQELAVLNLDEGRLPDPLVSQQKALAQRPELIGLQYAAEATRTGKKIAQGAWLPNIAAFGTLGYGKPGLDFINKEWMDYWLVGAGLEWNLWNWGKTRSQVQQAQLKITALQESEKQLREAISLDVTQACLKLQEAKKSTTVAHEIEKLADESFQVVHRRYQQGQASQSDFFDAQSEWTRAQLQATDADIELALAHANWRRAVGEGEVEYK